MIKHLRKEQESEEMAELEVQEKLTLLEWCADQFKNFGCVLEIVTNKSVEGSQFCRGFGGIGWILSYQLDVTFEDEPESDQDLE